MFKKKVLIYAFLHLSCIIPLFSALELNGTTLGNANLQINNNNSNISNVMKIRMKNGRKIDTANISNNNKNNETPGKDSVIKEQLLTKLNISLYEINNENKIQDDFLQNPSNFPHNLEIILQVLQKLDNKDCIEDTGIVMEAFAKEERWTLEMLDSFPKFPVGILYGNHYQMGSFDECINIQHKLGPKKSIKGQYCMADIHFENATENKFWNHLNHSHHYIRNRFKITDKTMHWAICLPSSCTSKDAQIFVREVFTAIVNLSTLEVEVDEKNCYIHGESARITPGEIVYGCVIGAFLMFTIFATAFHCWKLNERKKSTNYNVEAARSKVKLWHEVIISFSVIRNIYKFQHTKPTDLNLECIAGIKVLSMAIIIGGHALIFMIGGPVENAIFMEQEFQKVENGIFSNNPLLVDTFLLTSGFLLCRLLLIELDKRKGRLNVMVLYIGRYIRLTPSYLVVLGLYMTVLNRTGDGPFWNTKIELEKERCFSSWWTNLLYINNYVNTDKLCMFQSWYLAVDYHLFILAPAILYPLWKNNKLGEILLVSTTVLTVIVPFWITFRNNLDPTLLAFPPEVKDLSTNYYFKNVYIKTHMRASSYWMGLIFGYLVHKFQNSGNKLPKYILWSGWLCSTVLGCLSMFSVAVFYDPLHEYNHLESAIYASLHRVAWCISIGWILFVCITDNAGIVNKFLSYKLFIPLSRLTYCAYLTNGLIEIYSQASLRQPTYLRKWDLSVNIFGHMMYNVIFAFVLCIFFESPIHGLEKILMTRADKRGKQQKTTIQSTEDS